MVYLVYDLRKRATN